ncbi:MAG TPA: O-antigen ligase family protein [Flavisolibacter sp.]|jgi:hypothetical protein|nr:O-antigen ligase family protein [Flavisolibacter sp.]
MWIRTENTGRTKAIFYSLLLMAAGLFLSRATLSITMILFLALTLLHTELPVQLRHWIRSPFLLGLSFLFFIPLFSGLWSTDRSEWLEVLRIKLPLLLLPVAFAGTWQLSTRQWHLFGYFFCLLTLAGCCWSLSHYFSNPEAVHESYLRAKTLPVPFENDHVRFSWIVSIAAVTTIYLTGQYNGARRWLTVLMALCFAAYLHILSARTGLLDFYLFLCGYLVHLLFSNRRKTTLIIACVLVILPLLAWWLLPTFQNRVKYFIYDFSYIRSQSYLPGSNDGVRVLSWRAGLDLLREHPLGVGAGDVKSASYGWYDQHVPGILPADKCLPSSEWLLYGAAAGWPGLLLFTAIMAVPFLLRVPKALRVYWFGIHAMAAFSLAVDMGLENQYGVFTYLLVVLWWHKVVRGVKGET